MISFHNFHGSQSTGFFAPSARLTIIYHQNITLHQVSATMPATGESMKDLQITVAMLPIALYPTSSLIFNTSKSIWYVHVQSRVSFSKFADCRLQYSCVLPIDPLINLIGWSKGSKIVQTDDTLDLDTEWKLKDLEEIGTSQEKIDQLIIEVPNAARLPDVERLSASK
jgi:hypothetical protein